MGGINVAARVALAAAAGSNRAAQAALAFINAPGAWDNGRSGSMASSKEHSHPPFSRPGTSHRYQHQQAQDYR